MIRIANYSAFPFTGWRRTTVDRKPQFISGRWPDGSQYVLGKPCGVSVWAVDVFVRLESSGVANLNPLDASPMDYRIQALPGSWFDVYGLPTIGSSPFFGTKIDVDGASYLIRTCCRISRLLAVDLILRWYPDQQYMAQGEIIFTASNPDVEDLVDAIPADFELSWGDAILVVEGLDRLRGRGIGDGQAHSLPISIIWPRIATVAELMSATAATQIGGICCVGLEHVWPNGNPYLATSPLAWARENLPRALSVLGTYQESGLGVAAYSGRTGAQEDQTFVGAEIASPRGIGAETVRYLVALGQSRQPCHHLEADGNLLDLTLHPNLVMWSGRPHYDRSISPDQLGKPRQPNGEESFGWSGPDEQHWMINSLCVAYRATGSPALQWQLEHHARNFILHFRRPQAWGVGELRTVGWMSLVAYWLWQTLEDRILAWRVRARWHELAEAVRDGWSNSPWWWVSTTDPRLAGTGRTRATMLWQHGLCTYGLDLAGQTFEDSRVRELAFKGAYHCLSNAWTFGQRPPPTDGTGPVDYHPDTTDYVAHDVISQFLADINASVDLDLNAEDFPPDRFYGWGYVGIDPDGTLAQLVNGDGAMWGPGVESWMALTPATVLRHQPNHALAKRILTQFIAEAQAGGRWLPPELL